jgi:2-polyprenyl-6-methoxyphenol hydroxylase-like FAD-dependent oxidoreductase
LTDNAGRHIHRFSLAPGQVSDRAAATLVNDARWLLPPPFAAAVAAEKRPFIQAIFDYEAPTMVCGRLALLGDAAFVVRPHTAMGIAKAAADAMALRRYLAEVPDLAAALSLYDRERRAAGRAIADYGRRLGAMME